ncbi:LRR and CARD domains-containing protein 3) (Nucleotide-binding oligomerization domain protein 3) [Durusdinium trenchii]|uniref:LRR and CARD domains-containing protein 3 (Nucleotide-binding oligomerization domain protein 3 n=1 Tax=Durusdinium trenchii TaxID=1381693 RepID=A0ABP0KKU6_9DINO
MWALLTPPEPLLHSGQPLFACKPRIWIVAKAALYALCLGSLGSDIYASGSDLADPVLHIVVVTMAIQWPLFVALRNAAYPLSECYCNLQEDSTTAHVPMHLMKIWWVAKQKRILPSSNLQDIGAGVLGRLLEEDDVVTELKVSDNGIGPEGAESLFSALLSNETLTQLYLDGNPIGPDGLKLLPFLAKGPDKMIGSCDGYRKCLELSRSLDAFAGSSPLQLLSLSRTQLGSKLHPLAQFLSRTPTLKKLYLNDNGIGEAGARVLAEGLRANESLDVLTMNKNQLHDGVLIILQALAMPHGDGQLSTLYVAENHINNGILEDMLQVLPSIPCLKKLNLARNPFSLHVLTEALTRGVVLPELRVTARDQSGKDAVQYMRDLGTMVEVD